MKRVFRLPSLFTSLLLLGACQQIIGLGDYESVDDEEEEGGTGGKGGKGGTTSGGSSGKGGTAGSSKGGSGGRGGSAGKGGTTGKGGTSGGAGEAGMGADGGTGGTTGGNGGTGGSSGKGGAGTGGDAGSGGKSECPELTLQNVVGLSVDRADLTARATIFNVAIQQQLIGGAEDLLGLQFYAGSNYNGDATGTFELGTGVDDNYETCSRCLLVERDAAAIGNAGNARFFAISGTMDIDDDSEHMDGRPTLTLSDVTFVEVTIDSGTYVSTVVPDGDCYHIESYALELPTPAWNCPASSWGDNLCDCGCDEPDLECASPAIGACQECLSAGSCAQTDCGDIDFEDNSQCSATNPDWDCPFSTYGDGNCSCGCGSTDPDCASEYVGACDYCDEAGSCDEAVTDCSGITLDDNTTCTADQDWTCPPSYYSDGSCDCGCGVTDIDCPAEPSVETDCYCGTGSCSASGCADIDPTDVSQCL